MNAGRSRRSSAIDARFASASLSPVPSTQVASSLRDAGLGLGDTQSLSTTDDGTTPASSVLAFQTRSTVRATRSSAAISTNPGGPSTPSNITLSFLSSLKSTVVCSGHSNRMAPVIGLPVFSLKRTCGPT